MAGRRSLETRTFNISVVGLSGREAEKGVTGVGKSCLINRFMRPLADDYYTDHISVLSQSDFGGRVVNNDHFLYWGETSKTTDEKWNSGSDKGQDYRFHVIEQTEFIDDSSFQPFKSGKTEPYYKRCAQVKLQSAEKLMYICKNQLGLEHDFHEVLLPDGRLTIDGFVVVFDVSVVGARDLQRVIDYTAHILQAVIRTKRPVVVATTKNDAACELYVREVEKLLARKDWKNAAVVPIPLIETSAHNNVNVEQAFVTLAQLIDKSKTRPKLVPSYAEAFRTQQERLSVAEDAYRVLIRFHVKDYKAIWVHVYNKLRDNQDYIHYVELFGTSEAKKLFKKHQKQLEHEFIEHRRQLYLDYLRSILPVILPDLNIIADRSWPSILRWLPQQVFFNEYFTVTEGAWETAQYDEERIPMQLLKEPPADELYRNHVNTLRAQHRRAELKKQFKQLLEDNHNVCPGKGLNEVAIFFLGRECFSALSEQDKAEVYEQHQQQLREQAKHNFLELLLENPDLLWPFHNRHVTKDDIEHIEEYLSEERRFKSLAKLPEDRRVILLKHLGFIQSRENCPEKENCVDVNVQNVLGTKAHRPQSWHEQSDFVLDTADNKLNLVLLGARGLADNLVTEIRALCIDDEYTFDSKVYSLDYRPIDGDVTLPQNSFRTPHFVPHGCFCVFSCESSLDYVWNSLEKTLLSDLAGDRLPFQGLPIVIVLAHNPDINEQGLETLRGEGRMLAERLQCRFIDIPSSMMTDATRKFNPDQVQWAMVELVQCIRHRALIVNPWQVAESIEPDIRILMALMCGDQYPVELPVAPLLNHQCCYVTDLERGLPTITLETYLGVVNECSKRKVEVTVASYHRAAATPMLRDSLFHGAILVYMAKRKASLQHLSAFAQLLPPQLPIKILAVTGGAGAGASEFYNSEQVRQLITEGNALADRLHASFMTTCPNFQQQTASYTPFFTECWDRKPETEGAFSFAESDDGGGGGDQRVPERSAGNSATIPRVPLPKPPTRKDSVGVGKSSTSNSTEDSEPLYDRPHIACHSDSDGGGGGGGHHHPHHHHHHHHHAHPHGGDRGSSVSPPLPPPPPGHFICDSNNLLQGGVIGEDIYSEISIPDSEQLIKPSQVKSKRRVYAGGYDDDHPEPGKLKNRPKLPPKPLDSSKFADVNRVLQRNISKSSDCSSSSGLMVKPAPLATPEAIDIGTEYAIPKDAIISPIEHESNYSSVADALPAGHLARIRSSKKKNHNNKGSSYLTGYGDTLTSGVTGMIGGRGGYEHTPLLDALEAGSDSDSEFSSLERERALVEDIYSRVQRRPTPHKKKHKPRHSDPSLPPPPPPPPHYTDERNLLVHCDQLEKVTSNTPSEGSGDTGDELSATKKTKKRRSFKTKKKKPTIDDISNPIIISPPWSDTDLTSSLLLKDSVDDEGYKYEDDYKFDEGYDLTDSGYWKRKLRLGERKSDKDPSEKMKKKEEKKQKEDEKRRQKEEERRQKEQQKKARKLKKRGGGPGGIAGDTPSQNSLALEDMAQGEDRPVPLFMELCIQYIESEGGLQTEGLYRVPGNMAQVQTLMDRFREDPSSVDLYSMDLPVNAVGTSLKQWLMKDLPEPLVPHDLFDELIEAAELQTDNETEKMMAIRNVINKLPPANFDVLSYFIAHLYRVSEHVSENSMSSSNLAICWWPTLFRPDITSMEKVTVISQPLETILQLLIERHSFFFSLLLEEEV